jgi:flagella basal body P-ring formation protein FlgA
MLFIALFLGYLGADPSRSSVSFRAESRNEPVPVNVTADPSARSGSSRTESRDDDQVRAAIVAAVRQRMGADIDVVVDNLVVQVAPTSAVLEAVPEPTARLEGNIRFILRWSGTERSGARVIRAGAAVARVHVTIAHAHTTNLLLRGTELGADDVVAARHEMVSGPLKPLPGVADAVGSKTLRDLPPDACIVRGAIADRPDVRTGQEVLAISTITGVVASAQMVASESGDTGSVIRVVNRQSRRALKARIISPGLVEILK